MPRPSRTWNRLVSTPLPINTAPSVNTPSTSQRKSLTRRRRARSEDREVEIWRSDMRRGKLQTPSSKHQRSSKSQIPSLRRDSPTINECLDRDAFGALCLGFHWSLVFGVWCLLFSVRCLFNAPRFSPSAGSSATSAWPPTEPYSARRSWRGPVPDASR